jgi:TrmH family RNA methyltransferase
LIPFYKLEKLPRIQKLRKIAKVISMAENRLAAVTERGAKNYNYAELFNEAELAFFTDAAKLLAVDTSFSADKQKVFVSAVGIFQAVSTTHSSKETTPAENVLLLRRLLNNIKHILLTETGRDQADWDFTGSDGRLDPKKRQIFEGMWVYMEDIRSPFNVGAMFRTAESFGVEKIFLSPLCADPRHRRAERTAMGCIDIIPWERQDFFAAPDAPQLPCPVFALETGGTPLEEFSFPRRGLLIAGSEELGVSPRALAAADASLGRVSIPCYGVKASLNVSTAFGITMQKWAQTIASF